MIPNSTDHTFQGNGTYSPARLIRAFLVILLITSATEGYSQFIQRVLSNNCVGGENVFIFTVSGCSVTWGAGGGSYTILGQDQGHIRIKWNSPTSTAYVYANYNCPNYPWSGSYYYPQFTISGSVTPSVSIVASQNNVCLGTNITFTATPTNGGSSPNYVWKRNGNTVQSGSSNQYSSTALQTGDVVKVEMASNAPCPNPTGATSNSITMTFTQPSPASVSIQGPPMPMCGTTGASFVATPTNGGSSPTYTWYKNGNIVNDNAPGNPPYMYSPQNPLGDGVKVKCVMTSNQGCVSGNPATSNEITVTTTAPLTPQVGINPVPINFCEGDQVTFAANEANTGYTFTTHSWKLNGEPVGTNSDTYTTTAFTSGSVVTVDVTVTGSCISQTSASGTTAGAPIVVKPLPNAGIDPAGSITIFSDVTQEINASPGGGGHTYVWKRNGNVIPGETTASHVTDIAGTYTVEVTYDGCTKTSPSLALSVNVKPVVTIQSVSNVVLPATGTAISGSATDGDGTITAYHWTQQSGPFAARLDDEQSNTLAVSNLTAGGTYVFRLTATDNTGEAGYDEVTVNVIHPPNNHNWIRETAVTVPGQENEAEVNGLDIGKKLVAWSYFDGLGRPSQKISVQSSPMGKDIVQPAKYDNYGREVYKFLPYVSIDENGYFKSDALGSTSYTGSVHQLYYTNGSTDKVADDPSPFSKTVFDQSPLNRVIKQGAPGTDWQPIAPHSYNSTDHAVKFDYQINDASEVLKWIHTPSSSYPQGLVSAKLSADLVYFAANQLTRNKNKDEDDNEVIEYKDIEGRVVLKKVEAPGGQWAQTYYIYNDMGDLACVLPPEAVARLDAEYHQPGATDATKDSFLGRWAFRYTYDGSHRMILKQVPGAEPVYMVYDQRDRLALTQDGNQRSGATKYWTFTKYDQLNRPVLTGIHTSANTLSQMQTAVDSYYANLTGSQAWYESYVGSVTGNAHGYNNASFPQTGIPGYLTVTYYDNYAFRSTWIGTYAYANDGLSQTLNGVGYSQPTAENARVTGRVTGAKVKVLDGGVAGGYTWLKSVSYYDDNQQVIQAISENYKGGTDRVSTLYDFTGRVLKTRAVHTAQDVTWTARVGLKEEGNKLTRTAAGSSWGGAGAASVQELAAGTDGWMEFVASETNQYRMIGLSDQNTNAHYNTIDFAWYLLNNGTLQIYESGANRGNFGTYSAMDVFRIERTGTSVKYYHNNILKRTVTVGSTPALMADVALYSVNATVTGVRSSFSTETETINRRYVYDHAGRLTHTWHQVGSEPEILLAYNGYNELGQLVDKKLHSTTAGATDALQSVDYRYNIRGWMTSINNAELNVSAATNDETGDLFGMNLAFQDALSTGNAAQYNGNISGAKWSVNQGFGDIKAMAYNYSYDPMNRLTAATHKQAQTLGTWLTGQFDENGLTYDLNGNIKTLQRKGEDGVMIDNLTYNYGAGATASNKLLYVTDAAVAPSKVKGFLDGNTSGNDYTYDANGNMQTDKNKGISSNITYNYLNLPELVTRGGNTVRYIYDATGRKLAQTATFAGATKETDYAGEFIYENDVLQFINHEEGRIVVSGEKLLLSDGCENTGNKTASNATLATHTANGEEYIKVTANGTTVKTGVFPIGGSFPVTPGERYRIRAKGYRTGANAVYLLIKANAADLDWPEAALPSSAETEAWIEQIVTVPAGTSTLQAGVAWNTVTAGQIFYLNELEIVQLTTTDPEYQYHLKDHLGNVRVTFTSKQETDTYTATLENDTQAEEQATFRNYSRVTSDIYDHTDAGTTYDKAQLLNGGYNSQVGLTKSLAVMPGDTITAQVYAKYFEDTGGSGNLSGFAAALLSAFGLPTPAGGEAGTAAAAIQDYGAFIAGGGNSGTSGWPKGWLNMLVFDKDYNLVDLAYEQLDAAYMQPVGNVNKLPMQQLTASKTIKEPGYVYIYISNEGSVQQDVFFDDLKVEHTKSPVIAADDYYPFGLTFNSYERENTIPDPYGFNGNEQLTDLSLDLVMTDFRMFDPSIARLWQIDLIDKEDLSPYAWGANNPVLYIDIFGLDTLRSTDPNFDWDNVKSGDVVDGVSVLDEVTVEGEKRTPQRGYIWVDGYGYVKSGDKVMRHRDGVPGLEDLFGHREIASSNGIHWVDAEGRLMNTTPIALLHAPPAGGGSIRIVSQVKKYSDLLRVARQLGKSPQLRAELNKMIKELSKGNFGAGRGAKSLGFGGVNEMRGYSAGARVYFRNTKDGIEIVAYSDKATQSAVIKTLREIYGK